MKCNELVRGVMAVMLGSLLHAAPVAHAAPPNIVVFISDDHGYLDSTVYGATDVRTPNMQQLARDGMTLTHAFVATPSCAPSRAALLTGLMPARNGAEANHTYARKGIQGIPACLRALGYEVAAFGKVAHSSADAARWNFDHVNGKFDLALVAEYLAKRDVSQPLCLFCGTSDPHVVWTKNTEYDPAKLKLPSTFVDTPQTREYRADYYTEITRMDADLGRLRELAREKLGTHTLFLYTSDNGAQWPFSKWDLYDAGIRTPLLAALPGVIKPGSRSDAMVSWVDILPTLVELAGGTPAKDIDGRSFAGVLRKKTDQHRTEIYTTQSGDGRMNVYPIRALRTREFKYILNLHPEFAHTTHIDKSPTETSGLYYWRTWYAAAKAGDAKAAAVVKRYYERPREELYDLRRDPFETNNLAASPEQQATLRELRAKLEEWMKQQGDQGTVFNEPRLLSDPNSTEPAQPAAPASKPPKVIK